MKWFNLIRCWQLLNNSTSLQSFWPLNLQISDFMVILFNSNFSVWKEKKKSYYNYFLIFSEPVLSSNELDVIQYKISTPGSFTFAERPNGSVSIKQRKQLFCVLNTFHYCQRKIELKCSLHSPQVTHLQISLLYNYISKVSRKKSKLLLNFVLFQVTCLIGSLFQNTVNVVNIRIPSTNKEVENATEVWDIPATCWIFCRLSFPLFTLLCWFPKLLLEPNETLMRAWIVQFYQCVFTSPLYFLRRQFNTRKEP